MKTKTLALTAVAALALPAAAVAKKPAEHPAKAPKGKSFVVKGTTSDAALPVADGALTGALTLDPTSANKHARKALTLTKADIRGTATETFGVTGDEVVVKYSGLAATDALTTTDVVKVKGKVFRDGTLDIRRIQVVRKTAEEETPEQPQS